MKYNNNWILGLGFLLSFSAFSQEKYIKHTVSKGETIIKIAQQYHVKTAAIYDLNPDSKNGIKFKSVLLIPSSAKEIAKTPGKAPLNTPEKIHYVLPKETLYGIAKQYGLTVNDLYKANPTLEKVGLKKGVKINIPVAVSNESSLAVNAEPQKEFKNTIVSEDSVKKEVLTPLLQTNTNSGTTIVREVLQNETKYAIAKEYGITVADIDKSNPFLVDEPLKIGDKLIIPVKNGVTQSAVIAETTLKQQEIVKPVIIQNETPNVPTSIVLQTVNASEIKETDVIREVLSKETKYGIAKEYGITVAELENQNPAIKKGLPVGYKLNIRSKKEVEADKSTFVVKDVINNPNNLDTNYDVKAFHGTDFLDQLVTTASENIGTRYRPGGTSKDGFDCSGLMCTTFGAFDIELPRTSLEQSQYGVKINNEDAQKGDLIFFKTNGRRQINHVGMVVEVIDGDIKFIHASNSGVIISSIKEKYYSKRVTQINRVL